MSLHSSVASTVITSWSSQGSVVSGNSSPNSGAIVSSIVNVDDVVEVFPQSSEAVNTTVVEPVAPQSSDIDVKSLLQVMLPQLSEAEAPPFESNQAPRASRLPDPSHSTVTSAEAGSIEGVVVS